jgi:hypothetical protein
MARARKKQDDQVEELGQKDFARAVELYRRDIRPAQSKVGEFAQEQSTAYKEIKKACRIQPQAARAAFRLAEMEEAKRDDYLRGFNGLLNELGITPRHDLVDAAEGKGEAGTPKDKPGLKLVTIPTTEADDERLETAADEVKVEQTGADGANAFLAKAKSHLGGDNAEQPEAAE